MHFYLPVDLDLSGHYDQHPPFKGFKKDKMNLILHTIISIPVTNKHIDIVDGFVPLSAAVLQEQFHDYKKYLTYALTTGLLASDGLYIKGYKCTGYKIAIAYGNDLQTVPVHDFSLRSSINKRYQELCKSAKGYGHLNAWFGKGLAINTHHAITFLKEEYLLKTEYAELRDFKMVYDIRMLSLSGKKGGYKKEEKDPKIQYQQGLLSINRLLDGKYSYTVDSTVGRYHSVLTNMRSPLRNFLTFNGAPLVSIDIKNSQPYLLCLLLQVAFWKSEKIVRPNSKVVYASKRGKTENSKPKTALTTSFHHDLTTMSMNTLITIDSLLIQSTQSTVDYFMLVDIKNILLKSGFEDYIEKVTNGVLYESLQDSFEQVLGYSITDRQELKKAVFQVLFTPNTFIGQEQAAPKRVFKECYPEVYALCNAIKKKDSTLLPRLLQQIESHIMLNVVAKRMQKEFPKVPIFTVHDSIMTTAEHQELVARVMREELTKCVGYAPTLSTEFMMPERSFEKLAKMREQLVERSA